MDSLLLLLSPFQAFLGSLAGETCKRFLHLLLHILLVCLRLLRTLISAVAAFLSAVATLAVAAATALLTLLVVLTLLVATLLLVAVLRSESGLGSSLLDVASSPSLYACASCGRHSAGQHPGKMMHHPLTVLVATTPVVFTTLFRTCRLVQA